MAQIEEQLLIRALTSRIDVLENQLNILIAAGEIIVGLVNPEGVDETDPLDEKLKQAISRLKIMGIGPKPSDRTTGTN